SDGRFACHAGISLNERSKACPIRPSRFRDPGELAGAAMRPLDVLKLPFWTLALATGAKSFRDNRVIGSPALNRRGLHMRRVKLAHDLAWSRRRRLQRLVSSDDRAAFDRDGFVLKRDFLDRDFFARLRDAVMAFEGPAREMVQGDTITRRIALDGPALAALPMVREV